MQELEQASKKLNEASDLIKQAESVSNQPVLTVIKERLWRLSDMLEKIASGY
jgi:hypothetical protein